MNIVQCWVGRRVQINTPSNSVLNGEIGVICDTDGESEISVRFEQYKKKFDDYDDTRRGWVTVDPRNLEPI